MIDRITYLPPKFRGVVWVLVAVILTGGAYYHYRRGSIFLLGTDIIFILISSWAAFHSFSNPV